jgi:hypothetical protein
MRQDKYTQHQFPLCLHVAVPHSVPAPMRQNATECDLHTKCDFSPTRPERAQRVEVAVLSERSESKWPSLTSPPPPPPAPAQNEPTLALGLLPFPFLPPPFPLTPQFIQRYLVPSMHRSLHRRAREGDCPAIRVSIPAHYSTVGAALSRCRCNDRGRSRIGESAMTKTWLITAAAAAILGPAAATSHAADVQIFGIHTPNPSGPSHWAVYARISNPQSSVAGQPNVAGISSLSVDVLNTSVPGGGSATVNTALVTLPSGTTTYKDPDLFDPPDVGYGFWLPVVRSNGTADSSGIHQIAAGQYVAIAPRPNPAPYRDLVLTGIGLSAGSVAAGSMNGNITSSAAWRAPVQVATGTYTPSNFTGPASEVGLTLAYTPGTFRDLIRGSAATDWVIEDAVSSTIVDPRTTAAATTTVKAGVGDANIDGVVDFNDLAKLAQSYNTSGKDWFDGDFNYDGTVDFLDLALMAQNYNSPVPGAPVGASSSFDSDLARAFASVPEPGALGVIGVTFALATNRRRKQINP